MYVTAIRLLSVSPLRSGPQYTLIQSPVSGEIGPPLVYNVARVVTPEEERVEALGKRRGGFGCMQRLPRIVTVAQARDVLLEMSEEQKITAEQGEWQASIKKHNDVEFTAAFPEQETGTKSLLDASRILLEHGDSELFLD
jgi:hypothetical protein